MEERGEIDFFEEWLAFKATMKEFFSTKDENEEMANEYTDMGNDFTDIFSLSPTLIGVKC